MVGLDYLGEGMGRGKWKGWGSASTVASRFSFTFYLQESFARAQRLHFRVNLYTLKEERDIEPRTFMNLVSAMLYEKRFGPYFIEPLIAGLDSKGTPFVASTDLIGCPMVPSDFVVGGTCTEQLYGMCESLYRDNLVSWDAPIFQQRRELFYWICTVTKHLLALLVCVFFLLINLRSCFPPRCIGTRGAF